MNKIFFDDFIFISLVTFAAILCGSDRSRFFRTIFVNRVSLFIGLISYGTYLCHMPLMPLVKGVYGTGNATFRSGW